jgi:hypothetical protein
MLNFSIRCSTLTGMQARWIVTAFAIISSVAYPQSKLPKGDGAPPPARPTSLAVPTGASSGPSSGQGYYKLKIAKLYDNQGWGPGIEAGRMLLPTDWRTEGEVRWVSGHLGCPGNMIQAQFKATAPDGITGIEISPGYVWQWSSDPSNQRIIQQQAAQKTGCDAGPVMGAADYLRTRVIPKMRSGALIVGTEPLPALTQAKQAEMAENNAMLIKGGVVRSIKADAAAVRITYMQNGQQVEEVLSTTVEVTAKPTPNSAALMRGQMVQSENYYSMYAENVFAARAPAGKLDKKLIATIVASTRTDARWANAVGQVLLNIGNTQLKGAMDRQKIWHDAQQQISATITATYQHQQAVQDRAAAQFSQTIRGVETYVNPSTGTSVELTGGYNTAWVNNRGEYLLSDSPGFNPAVAFQEGWTELKKGK